MSTNHSDSRRQFLRLSTATAGIALLNIVLPKFAYADDLPHLPESDPTAAALGYKEDANKVDTAKFATYKPGQLCANCKFFQATDAKAAFAPCQIFVGKAVAAKGWCVSYNAKA